MSDVPARADDGGDRKTADHLAEHCRAFRDTAMLRRAMIDLEAAVAADNAVELRKLSERDARGELSPADRARLEVLRANRARGGPVAMRGPRAVAACLDGACAHLGIAYHMVTDAAAAHEGEPPDLMQ